MVLPISLEGKIAIVTGGSRGIGRATVEQLARAGCRGITINYLANGEAAQETAALAEKLGAETLLVQADVAREVEAKKVFSSTLGKWGRLDLLVNNAGICERATIFDQSDEQFTAMVDSNLRSSFLCLREAANIMQEQGAGAIVNVTSISGITGGTMAPAYGAAKAGIIAMTKKAAKELAPYRVRVNAVAPGYIDTDMNLPLFKDPHLKAQRTKAIPLGRFGEPEEAAYVIVFLLSELAGFVTGDTIMVTGGRTS